MEETCLFWLVAQTIRDTLLEAFEILMDVSLLFDQHVDQCGTRKFAYSIRSENARRRAGLVVLGCRVANWKTRMISRREVVETCFFGATNCFRVRSPERTAGNHVAAGKELSGKSLAKSTNCPDTDPPSFH